MDHNDKTEALFSSFGIRAGLHGASSGVFNFGLDVFSIYLPFVESYCMHYVQRNTVLYLPAPSIDHFLDMKLGHILHWEQT